MSSLNGKVAVVTGAAGGIGTAISIVFAAAGAKVVVCDLDRAAINHTVDAVRSNGGNAVGVQADVTLERSVTALVETVTGREQRVDVLVNCAGITVPKAAMELALEEWNRVIGVNLTGTFLCCRSFAPALGESGGGSIVNLSSIHGLVAPALHPSSAYAAAKAGVLGLTRSLAAEWGQLGIRVNAICPGYVRTDMTNARLSDPEFLGAVLERTPLRRLATPGDISAAALYLASESSGMVTGHALSVDGGWVTL